METNQTECVRLREAIEGHTQDMATFSPESEKGVLRSEELQILQTERMPHTKRGKGVNPEGLDVERK